MFAPITFIKIKGIGLFILWSLYHYNPISCVSDWPNYKYKENFSLFHWLDIFVISGLIKRTNRTDICQNILFVWYKRGNYHSRYIVDSIFPNPWLASSFKEKNIFWSRKSFTGCVSSSGGLHNPDLDRGIPWGIKGISFSFKNWIFCYWKFVGIN